MALKGVLGGGAAIETVLQNDRVHLGGQVQGVVNVKGGHTAVVVNFIELAFVSVVWIPTLPSRPSKRENVVYHRFPITGAFPLHPGQTFAVPFKLQIPWDMPFNRVANWRLTSVSIGVRAELDIAESRDRSDAAWLAVVASPSHDAVINGLDKLGFPLKRSLLITGQRAGSHLPFHQRVLFDPVDTFRDRYGVASLKLTIVTDTQGINIALEMSRPRKPRTVTNGFRVDHATAANQDWATVMRQHLDAIMGEAMSTRHGSINSTAIPTLRLVAPPASLSAPPAPAARADTVNLSRGGDVNLSARAPGLCRVTIGIGWGRTALGEKADIDLSAVVVDRNGRALGRGHAVCYDNLASPEGAVRHGGDARDGDRGGDDEIIQVDLTRCPPTARRIAFIASMGSSEGLALGQVRDVYIRVVNTANACEIARFELDAPASQQAAIVFGELRRIGSDWTFAAVGQGNPQGLPGILRGFGLSATNRGRSRGATD